MIGNAFLFSTNLNHLIIEQIKSEYPVTGLGIIDPIRLSGVFLHLTQGALKITVRSLVAWIYS
jgi:hypothetical protein